MVRGAHVIVSNDGRTWFEAVYVEFRGGIHYVHFGYNRHNPRGYRFCEVTNWK